MSSTKSKAAKKSEGNFHPMPEAVAAVVAEKVFKALKPRVVANHAYDDYPTAVSAGFITLSTVASVPKSSNSQEETLRYVNERAEKLIADIQAWAGDAFIAFAPTSLLTKAYTLGANNSFGPVTVGVLLWDSGDTIQVELQVTVLANKV